MSIYPRQDWEKVFRIVECVDSVLGQWCAIMKLNSTLTSDPDYISNCTMKEKNPSLVYWE